jgi:hypothetical protein
MSMNRKNQKTIRLNREALRNLTPDLAQTVAGGVGRPSDNPAACIVAERPSKNPVAC